MPPTQSLSALEKPKPAVRPRFRPWDGVQSVLAAVCVVCGWFAFRNPRWFLRHPWGSYGEDTFFMRAMFHFYLLLGCGIVTGWLLQPAGLSLLSLAHARFSPRGRRATVLLAMVASCIFVSTFLVTTGRHQFGAWDYNILIDVGWRQILGQRPFVDFVTPTPPFFNWTAALAFRLFGVTWNANLYLCALFSSVALIWGFLLLRGLGMRSFAALATSLLVQTAAMLTCCFWWYNNTTLVLASLFFCASLLLARSPHSRFAQISFTLLIGLLPLTKPNIAAVTIAGCLGLLLVTSTHRRRVLLLTLLGSLLFALLLLLAHVSFPAMMATYRNVAKERGGLSTFGFHSLCIGEQRMTWIWMVLFCIPLLGVWRPFWANLRALHSQRAAFWLFFPLSAIVAAYGIAGNGELRDVECTLLIAALGLLAFVFRTDSPRLTRFTVALMCGMFASDLYAGVTRLRVYTISPGIFFEWQDNDKLFPSGFLKDLRASGSLVDLDEQLTTAINSSPGPIFLGPRLEFEYAVHRLPSPLHWTSFFQPGTSLGRAQTSSLVQTWSDHRFPTLIFRKDDFSFYPVPLIEEIQTRYIRDDRYPSISVYRRRPNS